MVILKKVVSIATSLLLVLVVALCVFLFAGKMNGGKTVLFGNEIMVVLSGSMSPTFQTGSIVGVKPIAYEQIKVGDIITFKDPEGRTITHRVRQITENGLITKGDANDAEDSAPATKDRIIGEVQFSVPLVGYLIEFVKSKVGMMVFLGGPGLYLIISQVWKLLRMIKEKEAPSN